MITFHTAKEDDATKIAHLRQKIWSSTYRGIYSDEMIDHFNYEWHETKDRNRIQNENYHVYVIEDGEKHEEKQIGYFTFSERPKPLYKDYHIRLDSLYVLPEYQRQGIGTMAFTIIHDYCSMKGIHKFYLECHPENERGMAFYKRMGGIIGKQDCSRQNNEENSVWFEYTLV